MGRVFDKTTTLTNTPLLVTVALSNTGPNTLRGFFYFDEVPTALAVSTLDVTLDGRSVTNFSFESGSDGEVSAGCTPRRWWLETPTNFLEGNSIAPQGVVQIRFTISCASTGTFSLQQFGWAACTPDKTNTLYGYSLATDEQTVSFLAIPDTQAPSVPTNLVATAVSPSHINLSWAASTDNVGVAGYQVFRDGVLAGTAAGTTYADTNLASASDYVYTVAAFDAAGNLSATSTPASATTLALDTIPPTISFTAPVNGALVANTITISANATDNVAVVGVQFKLDGANLGTEVTSPPYQTSWNTATNNNNGAHTLSATARDAAGNSASASITVNVYNTAPTLGLVGYWSFDEGSGTTAADSSGNGHPATLVNGISWAAGKLGGAVLAHGNSDYVGIPAINLSTNSAVTVSLWVNRAYAIADHVLFENSANYNLSTSGFGLFPDDGTCGGLLMGVRGNVGYNVSCYAQPSSGVWHHLVAIFDKSQPGSTEVSLYVDGLLVAPSQRYLSADNTNLFGNNPTYLFCRGGSSLFTAGLLDELRLYNRALSASEIQQLYALGNMPLPNNTAPILPPQNNRTVLELTTLLVTNAATDSDLPTQTLSYQLLNPPPGASIDTNGLISWTPTEAQGPGTNVITTVVSDNGIPPLSATNSFTVVVAEVNTPPTLPPLPELTLTSQQSLEVTNTASDSDLPLNPLSYALQGPAGATIDANGIIRWQPTADQVPSTNLFTTVVTDTNQWAINATQLSATNSFTAVVNALHNGPVLTLSQTNWLVNELTQLVVTNTASASNLPTLTLTYTLLDPPTGASIDTNGLITWTPTEAQGPGTNIITTVVTDSGNPPLSATNSLTVIVAEVNTPPALPLLPDLTVTGQQLLEVTNTASDSDLPLNPLSYTLEGPAGATIDTNGIIRWQPTADQVPSTNLFTTVVTDTNQWALNATELSATNSFVVTVNPIPAAPEILSLSLSNNLVVITWTASAGGRYRLQYIDSLTETNWSDLSPDVTADGPTATATDTPSPSGARFYRVRLLGP